MAFSLLAIVLLVVDARFGVLGPLRQGVATILYPMQKALLYPRDWLVGGAGYLTDVVTLKAENQKLRGEEVANAAVLLRAEQLSVENQELRRMLEVRERLPVTALMAQVLYEARDPFIRRVVLDRGSQEGVLLGQPVVDNKGVVGQVTRVFPISSEVTAVNDQSMTVPVQIQRSGVRAIAYGVGQGMELRYLPVAADIRVGDVVVTSGLDGLYPAGIPVGTVTTAPLAVDDKGKFAPAKISAAAGVQQSQILAILMVDKSRLPPPPPPDQVDAGRRKR